ncbi:cyclic nucleotide-binding domain-containing protein [Roseomonas populi]|uniref:Cyclic nucleotide-binding domain-containing protein n=1 Tax=Roseomonas populi TaxID=3121582 RepID=A0ABT1XCJ3_9PROT|nr:cyclic nucleotide-binding domain-containing protein [Roseomonas pecuniae]MCR0985842.1 cyclic nucleotide-binding domain-containing protein [Roseomonas pecuniae]
MLDFLEKSLDVRQISRSLGVVLSFAPGDLIFREGDRPTCMYVLLEGEVEVRRGQVVIETVGPGQALGIVSLLDDEPRTVTAEARKACQVAALDARKFRFAVEQVPHFAWWSMAELAHRLRSTNAAL